MTKSIKLWQCEYCTDVYVVESLARDCEFKHEELS